LCPVFVGTNGDCRVGPAPRRPTDGYRSASGSPLMLPWSSR
jgi:hypothetical protein